MTGARTFLPYRQLPRPVSPIAGEMIESYLARLAGANRLDAEALRAHIAGDRCKSAPIPADVLARVSGQSERSLGYAIPGLGAAAEHAGPHIGRSGPHGMPRPACRLCAASRGHTGGLVPWCHADPQAAICRKHLRWLGDGLDHASPEQPDLADHPIIVHANQVHRKLAAQLGPATTGHAYHLAHEVCHTWRDRCERQEQFTELIRALRPGRRQFSATNPAVHAARYPRIVAVTRLLVTPDWRTAAREQWDRPEQLIRDLWRAAAPRPYRRDKKSYRPGTPLIEILLGDQ